MKKFISSTHWMDIVLLSLHERSFITIVTILHLPLSLVVCPFPLFCLHLPSPDFYFVKIKFYSDLKKLLEKGKNLGNKVEYYKKILDKKPF